MEKIDFKSLSILRGIAALYVVINHARGNLFAGGAYLSSIKELDFIDKISLGLLQLTSIGREFVILFFILSGFSIAYSCSRNKKIKDFYCNRFIRLYLPYLASFSLVFLVSILFFNLNDVGYDTISSYLDYALYLKSDGVMTPQYWSLVYEVVFYILAPFLFFIPSFFALFVSLIFYSYSIVFFGGDIFSFDNVFYSFFFDFLIFFSFGSFLFFNFARFSFLQVKKKFFYILCSFMFIGVIVMKKIFLFPDKVTFLFVIFVSLFLIVNVNHHRFKNRVLFFLGDISYSLYLNHFLIIYCVEHFLYYFFDYSRQDLTNYYLWFFCVPLCVFFSYLMWLFFEKYTIKVLDKRREMVKYVDGYNLKY